MRKTELEEIYKELMERRELKECWFTGDQDDDDYGDCFASENCDPNCPLERLRRKIQLESIE